MLERRETGGPGLVLVVKGVLCHLVIRGVRGQCVWCMVCVVFEAMAVIGEGNGES